VGHLALGLPNGSVAQRFVHDATLRRTAPVTPGVARHFTKSGPSVQQTYEALLVAAHKLGPVREEPKKTSIHLMRESAFAGVATRRDALVLTLKSDHPIVSPRIHRAEQTSANRWHLEIRLAAPKDVDAEVRRWLKHAYALG
jgi:hypothetical protein